MKCVLTAVVAILVLISVVKLSGVANERRAAPAPMSESLFTDALEPELPISSEVGQVDPSVTPTLTR